MVLDCIKAIVAGAACGAVFALFKLPAPAPIALAGVLGIVGVFLGYIALAALLGH